MDIEREELLPEMTEAPFEEAPVSPEIPAECLEECTQGPMEEIPVEAVTAPLDLADPVQEPMLPEIPVEEAVGEPEQVYAPPFAPNPYTQGHYAPDSNGARQSQSMGPYGWFPPNPYTQGDLQPYGQARPVEAGKAYPVPGIPQGNYGQTPVYGQPWNQGYRMPPKAKKSRKGATSLIFGILAVASVYFIPIVSCALGIIAMVFGIQTLKQNPPEGKERIMGIIGLVLGIVGILTAIVITVVTLGKLFSLIAEIEGLGEHKPM